ncbi:MAG: site-specific integrase [Acidaminococcaceae bacterium]
MDQYVTAFLKYLEVEKNVSPLTLKSYQADILLFIGFLQARKVTSFTWPDVIILDIRAYLAQMNEDKYARRTIARRISSLRSFYRYLLRENIVEVNPFLKVKTPKLEKRLPVFWKNLK